MILSDSVKEKLLSEVQVYASRSGGPGGQNVNKVSTKIELRFPVYSSKYLNEKQKNRIHSILKNRISASGDLIIKSSSGRTQLRNRQEATAKFFDLLEKALKTSKKRIPTKPARSANLRRLEKKKIHSQKKQLRKPPDH